MSVFAPSPGEGAFCQGEIISGVVQVYVRADSLGPNAEEVNLEEKVHPYALILTQDCDLLWDFKARTTEVDGPCHVRDEKEENRQQAKLVPNVLLCELTTAEALRPRLAGGEVRRRIMNNQDERYHCLPEAPAVDDRDGEGLPDLVADFKRVFSIPTEELYLRLGLGMRRRSLILPPYLQHLSSRFGYFCLRVALPEGEPALLPAVQQPAPNTIALPASGTDGPDS